MATLKTKANDASVEAFLDAVENETRRTDGRVLLDLMTRVTGCDPVMWGSSIVGFDQYHYKYDSGREGDFFITGFSPRKSAMTVYIMPGFGAYGDLMEKLGKYKTGKSCLYVNKLANVDLDVLEDLVRLSVDFMRQKYPK